jgi:hypothetical protein
MSVKKFTPLVLCCFFLHLPILLLGQYKYKKFTYIGLNLGLKNELYQVIDAGNELYSKTNFRHNITGIFVEQELNRHILLGTGIYFTKHGIDFRFRRDNGFNVFPSMKTTLIPLRLGFTIPLFYGIPEVRLVPQVGFNAVLNRTNDIVPIYGKIAPDLADTYEGNLNYDFSRWYFLAEGGLNFDILFAKGLIVSFGGKYFQGFTQVARLDVEYRIARVIDNGTLTSKGSFLGLYTGIKYPIHKFNKKKYKRK